MQYKYFEDSSDDEEEKKERELYLPLIHFLIEQKIKLSVFSEEHQQDFKKLPESLKKLIKLMEKVPASYNEEFFSTKMSWIFERFRFLNYVALIKSQRIPSDLIESDTSKRGLLRRYNPFFYDFIEENISKKALLLIYNSLFSDIEEFLKRYSNEERIQIGITDSDFENITEEDEPTSCPCSCILF